VSQVTFIVHCRAEPQGSKRAFVVPGKDGARSRAVVVDANKGPMRSYRSQVTQQATYSLAQASLPQPMAEKHQPVEITIEFMFLRPATCPKKRYWPVVKPDVDKLLRATLDALTGVLFSDDAQVVRVLMDKVYGPIEQVHVSARLMATELPF
jgi:crossover junction endodeoxyribonuclease RusA